jgi:hypothetical protein
MDNDFDAGINSSTAWTEALDGLYNEGLQHIKQARALYAFEGKPEFRELTVEAGDDLEIIQETLPDGWSLVRTLGDEGCVVGLLPRTYYTVGRSLKCIQIFWFNGISLLQTSFLVRRLTTSLLARLPNATNLLFR